jgi:hypothetical protein
MSVPLAVVQNKVNLAKLKKFDKSLSNFLRKWCSVSKAVELLFQTELRPLLDNHELGKKALKLDKAVHSIYYSYTNALLECYFM